MNGDLPLVFAICLVPLAVLVAGVRWAARRERDWMHDLLAPEAATGALTDDELGALAGSARDRRRFIRKHKSRRGRAIARRELSLGADLAEAIVISQGRDSAATESVRRELVAARSGT